MDHFGDDLNSEDIPPEAKVIMQVKVSEFGGTLPAQETHIVPESPTHSRVANPPTRVYPSLPSSNSAVTPSSGWNPPVVTSSQGFI